MSGPARISAACSDRRTLAAIRSKRCSRRSKASSIHGASTRAMRGESNVSTTGQVRLFEYEIDGRSVLRITRREDVKGEFVAEVVPYHVQVTRVAVDARIDADAPSLFAAMSAAGEQPELSVLLADIFSGEVDFNNDLQPGDRVRLLTERAVRDGRLIGYGAIQAAELDNDGRHLLAFRFQPTGAPPGYYDAEGPSLSASSSARHSGSTRESPQASLRAASTRSCTSSARTSAWTTAPPLARRSWRCRRRGVVRRLDRRRRTHDTDSSCERVRERLPAPLGLRSWHSGGSPRVAGPAHWEGRHDGAGHRPAPALRTPKGRGCGEPEQEHKKMPPGEPIPAAQMAAFRAARDRRDRAGLQPNAGTPRARATERAEVVAAAEGTRRFCRRATEDTEKAFRRREARVKTRTTSRMSEAVSTCRSFDWPLVSSARFAPPVSPSGTRPSAHMRRILSAASVAARRLRRHSCRIVIPMARFFRFERFVPRRRRRGGRCCALRRRQHRRGAPAGVRRAAQFSARLSRRDRSAAVDRSVCAVVYDSRGRNFDRLKTSAPLVVEDAPSLYFYRLRMGRHVQTGVAASSRSTTTMPTSS